MEKAPIRCRVITSAHHVELCKVRLHEKDISGMGCILHRRSSGDAGGLPDAKSRREY